VVRTIGYTNHLGLYGEEFGPQAQHLHNFPQAFTHLARPSTWTAAVGSRPRWMTASLAADVPLVRLHCRSIGGAGRVCGEFFWNHRLDARHQDGRAACLSSGR